jgi:DNA modification methylase
MDRDWQGAAEGAGLRLERRPVAALIPYQRNARTHDAEQIALIAGSIREFGFVNPVLVDGANGVICGHGRLLAARELGLETVPVIELGHLSEAQRRALVVADNRIAERAGWDVELLRMELGDLQADGFDLALTGFDLNDLERLLAEPGTVGLTDPNDVPAAPDQPASRAGDVWLLGRHRLVCGDATDPATVDRALGGVTPLLMVTDPPYGVNYDPSWRNKALGQATSRTGKVMNDNNADWREAWALFPGDVAYVWHGALHSTTVAESLIASGFNIRSQIVWGKERLVLSRGDYHWQHEPCWYAVRKNGKGHWAGDRKQTTLWQIPSRDQDADTVHGTQKPVECMRRPILNNSSPGQAVYEPFMGSGTTLIAAETTGRACLGVELSPAYVDVAVLRWQNFTGAAATLVATGATFTETANARAAAGPAVGA